MTIHRQGRFGQNRPTLVEAAASVVAIIPGGGRPSPPEDLNEAEAGHWRGYVAAMPDGWFSPETQPVLTELCRHVENARCLHDQIKLVRDFDTTNVKALFPLLKAHALETKFIIELSDKLRLTHKAKWSAPQAQARKAIASKIRPWEERE